MHNTSSALYSISIQIPSCPEAYGANQRRPAYEEVEGTQRHGDRMRLLVVWERHLETGSKEPQVVLQRRSKKTFVSFTVALH